MSDNSFSVHISYASADRADGTDARPAALALLGERRVVAAIRDASVPWEEGQEAILEIAVTDDAKVLTLSAQDTIETTLTAQALRETFAAEGMTLWLSVGDDDDLDDEEDDEDVAESSAQDAALVDDEADEFSAADEDIFDEAFDEQPVRVASFSHRGPMFARYIAESTGSTVDYVEAGTWSLFQYATTEPSSALTPTTAEAPIIELNLVDGSADWVEVHLPGLAGMTVPFWPQGERDTQPVIDLESITVPETKDIYRVLITDGDGSRDELAEIAADVAVDVDAAHRALAPESLGGVVGAEARTRAFLAAFDVPAELIDLALAGDDPAPAADLPGRMRIDPQGWPRALGDAIVGGYGEALPLTRRDRWDGRVSRALRSNPALATALSVGELALGVFGTSRLRGGWKSIGIFLIIDAIGDLIVAAVRRRRR